MRTFLPLFLLILLLGCSNQPEQSIPSQDAPFVWENANIYFLLTDRFNNGDPGNDVNFDRTLETAVNRGFQGGDILGVTQKINDGYFSDLGISAIWTTPFVEQNHGIVDEGTGPTYGFHGYWAQDWTTIDPNFGTEAELAAFIEAAHSKGIRVIMDVVINHTGPVTEKDPAWNDTWVRTEPPCQYQDYESTVTCTLVENLPDIRTESEEALALPDELIKKWTAEGRLEQEVEELDRFFERTGYPRTPTYYIIKWLTDYVRKYGIDGYRLDTAKHVEEEVWSKLRKEVDAAYKDWKLSNPDKVLADMEFYMVGEVYSYGASSPTYDFGDKVVNFYDHGIDGLINFEFRSDVTKAYEEIFAKYSGILNGALKDQTIVNYLSSHDDSWSYDKMRKDPVVSATKLLLSPGGVQIYYGDETARILHAEGAMGDAHLRSFMNWEELESNTEINGYLRQDILQHWQKLGKFRAQHPSVGAGVHNMLSESPYIFKREYSKGEYQDKVLVGLDLKSGKKVIDVQGEFEEGATVFDAYSGKQGIVSKGKVEITSAYNIVLLFA